MTPATNRPPTLASDQDRHRAATHVAKAFMDGRLDNNEHEERAGRVQAARTDSDLREALAGIPLNVCTTATPSDVDSEQALANNIAWWRIAIPTLAGLVMWMVWAGPPGILHRKEPVAALPPIPARESWAQVDEVVKAEDRHFRKAARYTTDWTSLVLANEALVSSDLASSSEFSIDIAEGHRGAVLTYDDPEGRRLTAVLNDGRIVKRRCAPLADNPSCSTGSKRGSG